MSDRPAHPLATLARGARDFAPWWLRPAAKAASRVLGLDDWLLDIGVLQQSGMDDPAYAFAVVTDMLATSGLGDLSGRTLLELGPGNSAFTGVIAHALGARRSMLIDAAPRARRDLEPYRAMQRFLVARGIDDATMVDASSFDALLASCNTTYLTDGLTSLRSLPAARVDFVFSHTVLQYVAREELRPILRELRRVAADDAVGCHMVGFADYMAGGLNHLRFTRAVWESGLAARAGCYTNRFRASEMVRAFEHAGFDVDVASTVRFPALPIARRSLAPEFRDCSDDDLLVQWMVLIARPALNASVPNRSIAQER